MIETSGQAKDGKLLDASYFPGWIGRYINAHEGTRFPLSFQALVGTFVLTAVVGRRARLARTGYTLWPPASILLLGHSGVGKSASLQLGRDLVGQVVELDARPTFLLDHALEYTPSSLIQEWMVKEEELAIGYLEGCITANELKSILKERTGNENAAQFLIEACEHRDLTSKTVSRGTRTVKNVTFAFGFCSSLTYLRQSLSADEFGGGLMHRFLIAHETKKGVTAERAPEPETVAELATELKDIAESAPQEMKVERGAESELQKLRNLAEVRAYTSVHLAGFWNRFDAITAKLALAFALSTESGAVKKEHVETAGEVLSRFLYPPLEALVLELSHGPRERKLFDLSDDLALNPKGLPLQAVLKRLPGTTMRARRDALDLMQDLGLVSLKESTVKRL